MLRLRSDDPRGLLSSLRNLRRFTALRRNHRGEPGHRPPFLVEVGELDVSTDPNLPEEDRLALNALGHAEVVRACLDLNIESDFRDLPWSKRPCMGVTVWGSSDRYSWLAQSRPTLLTDAVDDQGRYERKPAYWSVWALLEGAPGR